MGYKCKDLKGAFASTHATNARIYHLEHKGRPGNGTEQENVMYKRHYAMTHAEANSVCQECTIPKLKRILGMTDECKLDTHKVNPADMCLCPKEGQELPSAEPKSCVDLSKEFC